MFLTSTQDEFVFRGVPHHPWQFPTDQFMVNKTHEQNCVPVPFPYLLEPSPDFFRWSLVIIPGMSGRQGQDKVVASQLSFKDRLVSTCALASMLVELQSWTWEFAGKYDVKIGNVKLFEES